jgi:myo-inositol 2-dehydrogenase/D-chiro-inositol 1-dehydrogenase
MADSGQARIGFVGAGSHATSQLYPSLVQAPSARLVAVCDLQADRAESAAKRFGADRWYTNMEAMLESEQLDGVCICGDPAMHFAVGLQVLRRKLPIFVEKPSAMTAAQARRLADAAERAGVWGMVAFMKRHAPAYELARELIGAPGFGGVQQIHLRFTQGEYPDIWGLEAPQGFLVGQVVHIFDLMRFLAGDVADLLARLHLVSKHRFGYAISVRFMSGAVGTLELNTLAHAVPWRDIDERVDVSGVAESITVEDMLSLTHRQREDWRPQPRQRYGVASRGFAPNWLAAIDGKSLIGYVGEVEHFARCLLARSPAQASLRDGSEALRIGEAVWKSAQTGRSVSLTPRAR